MFIPRALFLCRSSLCHAAIPRDSARIVRGARHDPAGRQFSAARAKSGVHAGARRCWCGGTHQNCTRDAQLLCGVGADISSMSIFATLGGEVK